MACRATIPEQARRTVLSQMLHRCSRPVCRRRSGLGFLPLVRARGPLDAGQVAVLCDECLERARRSEFSVHTMQLWRLRGLDYWENVGAE